MENLEDKLEKPDWKQYLPVYGMYKLVKDANQNKPTIMDNCPEPWLAERWKGYIAFQTFCTGMGIIGGLGLAIYGLHCLIEKLQ